VYVFISVYVCVCVCMCVRETDRGRERELRETKTNIEVPSSKFQTNESSGEGCPLERIGSCGGCLWVDMYVVECNGDCERQCGQRGWRGGGVWQYAVVFGGDFEGGEYVVCVCVCVFVCVCVCVCE
jgi:hypothetical protein